MTYVDASTTMYAYDAGTRLTSVVDSLAGTISRTSDGLDRLIQEATPESAISYTYDAAGRRTGMTVADQPAVTYGYDSADRLASITQGTAGVTFAYDADSRRTSLTLPNGIVVEYAYDGASRLTGLTYTLGGTTLGTLTYTYDASGNRALVADTWARTGLPVAVATASYDAANEQLAFGGATMTFDNNGNLATLTDASRTTTYTWNARNQLASLSAPNLSASFGYDGLGRRRTKTINGARTDFLYDGLNPVQEGILPGTVGANLLTGLRIDEYLTRTDAAGARHFLPDVLGSTLALTDPAGAVSTEYTYEPFEATTATGAMSTNSFQYTGRENDGTGLYSYRARYYSATNDRFVAEDPLARVSPTDTLRRFAMARGIASFEGATSPARAPKSLYAYANNAPLRYLDPLGLDYLDISLSFGPITGGLMFDGCSAHFYAGGDPSLGSPMTGSMTWSESSITPGFNIGLQGNGGLAGQVGYSFGPGGGPYGETGVGGPPGASLTLTYIWPPFWTNPKCKPSKSST